MITTQAISLEPKLNIFACPFNFLVVPKQDLSDAMQQHLGLIAKMKAQARIRAVADVTAVGYAAIFLPKALPIPLTFQGVAALSVDRSLFKSYSRDGQQELEKAIKASTVPGNRYAVVNALTRLTSELIVSDQNVKAISKIANTDSINVKLSDYKWFIVDNEENIILLESPNAPGIKDLREGVNFIKQVQWKQPFQRTRTKLPETFGE